MRRVLIAFALLTLVSCGGGNAPTAPSTPAVAQVAGGWSGTFEASQLSSGSGITALVMDLTQAGSSINGTYVITGFASGAVTGTVTTSTFSGSLTFNAQAVNGSACTGTFSTSGSAGGTTMRWTSPGVTGNCTNLPTGITIAIQRR